jgi:hypothetical protein
MAGQEDEDEKEQDLLILMLTRVEAKQEPKT